MSSPCLWQDGAGAMAGTGSKSGVAGNTLDASGATVVADVLAGSAGFVADLPGGAGFAWPMGGFVAQSGAASAPAPVSLGTASSSLIPIFQVDIGAGYSETPLLLPAALAANQVTAISLDGVNFLPVGGGTQTVSGTTLTMTAQADGMATIGVVAGQWQATVDAIQGNFGGAAPISQNFYYQLADGSTHELAVRPNDIQPATLGEQSVPTGTLIGLAALQLDVALATGQTNDQSDSLSATVSVVNGTLAIDPTLVGAAANTGETVTTNSAGSITIAGTVAQINAELLGLTYVSNVAGNDPITLAVSDGPQSSSNVVGVVNAEATPPPLVDIAVSVYGNLNPTGSAIIPNTGATVTGISTDGVHFTAVSGTDASFVTTPSVAGQYVTLAMNADGTLQLSVSQGGYASVADASNALIDVINNAQFAQAAGAPMPPTDNFYYQMSDGNIGQIAVPLSDIYVPVIPQPGFETPMIVSPNSSQLVGGLRIDQALVAGQSFLSGATSDQGLVMSVSVDPFDTAAGVADGVLSIPTVVGGASVVADASSGVSITGTVTQIDAALTGLTYQSGATANDSITLSARSGAQNVGPLLVGKLATSIGTGGATGSNNFYDFNVSLGVSGYGGQLGQPVTGVSADDVNFQPVTTTDPSFVTSTTVYGLNGYLSFAMNADGTNSVSVASTAQTLIDAINANDGAALPLSDSFYYTLSSGVTDQVTYQLSDVSFSTASGAPFGSAETVAAGSATLISGISIAKALSSGQLSNSSYVLSVTISLFDFNTQTSEGTLSINGAAMGVGGNLANVSVAAHGGISITDSIGAINADLQGLTYTAGLVAATDSIVTGYKDAPSSSSGGLVGTLITAAPACYGPGTLISTPSGSCAIDALALGDLVLTASGQARAVRWIGYRAVECASHPDPAQVWPVRVSAEAFGEGVPVRDLWLSPGHNVALEGVLMPICALINGRTVVQHRLARTEYWHVELDSHDIILAEGLAAESYLDTGNRSGFANGAEAIDEHPDFGPRDWRETCLPLMFEGEAVQRARAAVLARAEELGHRLEGDAGLHVLADGRRVAPVELGGQRVAFLVPEGARRVRLRSRRFVPAQCEPASSDTRVLGVCVGRVQLDGEAVELGDAELFGDGWHGLESWGEGQRWTDGDAALPAGVRLVVMNLIGSGRYWINDDLDIAAPGSAAG